MRGIDGIGCTVMILHSRSSSGHLAEVKGAMSLNVCSPWFGIVALQNAEEVHVQNCKTFPIKREDEE